MPPQKRHHYVLSDEFLDEIFASAAGAGVVVAPIPGDSLPTTAAAVAAAVQVAAVHDAAVHDAAVVAAQLDNTAPLDDAARC